LIAASFFTVIMAAFSASNGMVASWYSSSNAATRYTTLLASTNRANCSSAILS
jgi:hypothetical protein